MWPGFRKSKSSCCRGSCSKSWYQRKCQRYHFCGETNWFGAIAPCFHKSQTLHMFYLKSDLSSLWSMHDSGIWGVPSKYQWLQTLDLPLFCRWTAAISSTLSFQSLRRKMICVTVWKCWKDLFFQVCSWDGVFLTLHETAKNWSRCGGSIAWSDFRQVGSISAMCWVHVSEVGSILGIYWFQNWATWGYKAEGYWRFWIVNPSAGAFIQIRSASSFHWYWTPKETIVKSL